MTSKRSSSPSGSASPIIAVSGPSSTTGSTILDASSQEALSINPKKLKYSCANNEYVNLDRFEEYLSRLELFHQLECPILLEGPLGCGKSSLIEEFHNRRCKDSSAPIILNMGEQSDAKTLFGAFVTNPERPGEFCWKAGVILEALRSGRWLVIEDVDLASPEMIATIKGLLESKSEYYVAPMGRSFDINVNFRLIATRRCDSTSSSQSTAFDRLGRDLWQTLQVTRFSHHELKIILSGRFPRLNSIVVNVILNLFVIVEARNDSEVCTSLLFKFCSRVCSLVGTAISNENDEEFLSEELRQALLYEAVDCFASSWSSRERRQELAKEMSILLSLPESQIDSMYESRPMITLSPERTRLSIGRVSFSSDASGMSGFRSQQQSSSNSIALTTLTCQTLEKLAVAVKMNEPVLLVGETGTGKTTTIQHLAQLLQFQPNLRVLNMSQQSEASDLLGGFKPFSAQSLARPLLEEFLSIFGRAFSKSKNGEYLTAIQVAFQKQSWKRFIKLVKQAIELISGKSTGVSSVLLDRLKASLDRFEAQVSYAANNLLFSFVEGSLVEALTEGQWLLLDEINLASPETLNILAGLLRSSEASVTLTERGDSTPIQRHPNFRLFACMNPATDVSKRDLPPAIRSRFTQIFVDETDVRRDDLRQVIDHLIGPGRDGTLKERLTALYYRLKDLVQSFELVDGNGRKPLLNLRTLTRPIKFARACESVYGLDRALYEGWCLSFTTMLDESSAVVTRNILREFLMPSIVSVPPLRPFTSAIPGFTADKPYIIVEGHILFTGPLYNSENSNASSFVLTPSVQKNVAMLSRAVMARNYPILLEGPTSAGKTSVIEYLANRTGHHFVRINNHEHTDIQEYLGSYVSDPSSGRLMFKEGILVQALRRGHWLVLDELNLAPSDILEALNRLLDDNRELFLPETGETVRPHPDFQLFATQNPAGAVYGGRKALSRAFRSRFLELQFNDLPLDEIEEILSSRCKIAPSFARRIAQVYRILQERRSTAATNIFAGKHALITLRDCFRWAERHSHSAVGSTKELAQDGYFVLAERCRHPEEAQFIRTTLEKVCKTELDSDFEMYDLQKLCSDRGWTEDMAQLQEVEALAHQLKITWTKPIRRLFTLVYLCIRFREPVILVGETGCGKTTVCQLLARILERSLRIVNCHANSESGDFLGSFRPIRSEEEEKEEEIESSSRKLFQWADGPLVEAMSQGDLFLMDEISLADDSVLERLNSVLEPSRYLLLAECTENDEARVVSASDKFSILATMNPGGDFGKKELSPALRNRFTEIWVPTIGDREDLMLIISSALKKTSGSPLVNTVTEFWYWWQECNATSGSGTSILSASKKIASSLRDLLCWLSFSTSSALLEAIPSIQLRLLHGAAMIFTDRLGSENAFLRNKTLEHLANLLEIPAQDRLQVLESENYSQIASFENKFSIGPFNLPINSSHEIAAESSESFAFEAPTTRVSALRVLRALQLGKAVLLEGSPGVGKTTLIDALATATGNRLTRINLSEQTDLVDLFGSDLPVDGGVAGRFRWADGPFLQALKRGDWILLDELNLASQSVLEGLNACLDHRASVFIPELNKEFQCSPGTRIFAAQNPAGQGGGRKGLPKSFLNRFTVVWFDSLMSVDYQVILMAATVAAGMSNILNREDVDKMIEFNETLNSSASKFSSNGRPWEFNLRDLTRWVRLIQTYSKAGNYYSPVQFIRALYASRFRCEEDFQIVGEIVEKVYGAQNARIHFHQVPKYDIVGCEPQTTRFNFLGKSFALNENKMDGLLFLRDQLCPLEAAVMALEMGWLCILTGPGASGKSALIDSLACLGDKAQNRSLRRFFVSPDTDTLELLGSFEQVDYERRWNLLLEEIKLYGYIPDAIKTLSDAIENFNDELLTNCPDNLKLRVNHFLSQSKTETSEGRFEWVDGPLVRAMLLGHWLVLENVNLASSAVLDRLNSLFEPNGSLVLSEQGCSSSTASTSNGVRIIRPTPEFRLFMTVDPKFGEISRAMRNRGIEIACFPRNETRVLDDLQVIRQEMSESTDQRIVSLLLELLPLKPSRRLLRRIAHAASIAPSASVETLLGIFVPPHQRQLGSVEPFKLNSFDSYWLQDQEMLPFMISARTANVSLALQNSMLQKIENCSTSALSPVHLALLSLFLIDKQQISGLDTSRWNITVNNQLSQLNLLLQIVQDNFNLSPEQADLLEKLKSLDSSSSSNLIGYLIWMISNSNSDLKPHEAVLYRMLSGQIEPTENGLEEWITTWRHYGFKNDSCAQIYLKLRAAFNSESVLNQSEAIQKELVEALEAVLSSKDLQSDLLVQLEKFSQLISNNGSDNCLISTSHSKDFLVGPKTLIFLNKMGSLFLNRLQNPSLSISVPRSTLSQEWLSQVWSLVGSQPLHFFSGFDGLGSLLENANRAWNSRTTQDELDLMNVFDDVLKFVVQHGGKDKRVERLHLLKGLFSSSNSESSESFARDLVFDSIDCLENAASVTFDPVADHFQVNQRALSTAIEFYSSKDQWERTYNVAYLGSSFLVTDHNAQIQDLSGQINEIQEFILVRPEANSSVFHELASICSGRLRPLLAQARNVLGNSLNSSIQCETLQMSLLRVRNDLLADRFVLYRDITAPFVGAIDRLKVGLYLIQIDSLKQSSGSAWTMLPLGFTTPQSLENWSFTASDASKHLVADSVALHTARFIPQTDAILREIILPVLARTLEHVHDELKAEVSRNQKNDSVFVFKGSNNDDDALDAELSSELFGDFEKSKQNPHDPSESDNEEVQDVEMTSSALIEDKRINYSKVSSDLYFVCSGIAASNDSKSLNQISEIVSRSYEFIASSVNLSQFSDGQVYRMLIWTLSEKLAKRRLKALPKSKIHYDFYRDACPEGRLQDALKVIQAFHLRLQSLLQDWPEHDVLQGLERQVSRFFKLPVSSTSMIEALLSLEKLYLRSQDWEKYAASSQTFLGQCVSDLLHLIVDWRRAEVENWRGLLDAVVLKMESESIINSGEWLPIARVAISNIDGDGREAIDSIISLIDTFILAAPVGQFAKRLEILEFCSKLSKAAAASSDSNATTSTAFATALLYYQTTLAHRVREYVRMCREPVERDLSAFLMTLYWKDINYWSVRQTSEKSHRHLARMVRKWKESMQMPLSSLLNQLTIKAQIQLSSMENPNISKKQHPTATILPNFKPLTSLGLKVKSRLEAVNYSLLAASSVESFGTSILETLNQLKESTEASIQPKQKAFVDLIRELKVFGIRINRTPSPELLAAKPILCSYAQATNLNVPRDVKAEYYLIRTLEKWQKLASAVAHEDITFRQAEIIKNSVAYLIEVLACGSSRALRDSHALEAEKLQSFLENISYRQGLSSSLTFTDEVLESFKSILWKAQVSVSQLTVLFESHRSQSISSKLNWSVHVEVFSLSKSTISEVLNLLSAIRTTKGHSTCVSIASIERISLILSSLIQSSISTIDESLDISKQVSDLTKDLKSILHSLLDSWTRFKNSSISLPDLSTFESDNLIRKILLSVQVCENDILLPEVSSLDEYSFYPDYMKKQAESSAKAISSLKDTVLPAMETILGSSSCPVELVEVAVLSGQKLLNWIDTLVLEHYRQVSRLTLILSNVFLHLYQEGFCRPPPVSEDQNSTEDSKDGKLTEGMGIGEGEGEKNVSKEIEFEEQVTGTLDEKDEPAPNKKDEEEQEDKDKDGEEDKLDMTEDFDGQLEDLMNDEKEKENDIEDEEKDEEIPQDQMKNSDDEDQQNNNPNEEEIQDLDPSWWNSDDDQDSEEDVEAPPNAENQKLPDNQNQKDQKDQEKEDKKSKNDKEEEQKEEQAMTAGTENQDLEDEQQQQKEQETDHDEINPEEAEDNNESMEPDNENDDVEMDDADKEKDSKNDSEMEDLSNADAEVDAEMENLSDSEINPESDENNKSDEDIKEEEFEDENASIDKQHESLEAEENDSSDDEKDNPENEEDTVNADNNQLGQDDLNQTQQDQQQENTAGETTNSMQLEETSEQQTGSDQQVRTFDNIGTSANQQDQDQSIEENRAKPQPSDQVEKWKRTVNRILNQASESKLLEDSDKLTKEQQYEQAINPDDENALTVKAEAEESVKIGAEDDKSASQDKASLNADDDSDDGLEAQDQDLDTEATDKEELKLVPHLKKSSLTAGEDLNSKLQTAIDKDLEKHLMQLSLLPSWSHFEQATSELAFDLCEQLRLVLAPTLATKLRGDYRTGKRLNLRKILPYIASQYRRDKIWLRRTKPSQRNYRLCLSIDNSKSMMETGSVGLAFEAIATISQALERLEVGELALIGFGDQSRVLQPFSAGVAKVSLGEDLRADLLKFDEDSTDVPALLESVLETFASAPASNSAPVWQLNIILSDGICHQHDKIKPLLARCHSARILNIFVLLDSRPIESSIFELSHVEYVDKGIDPMTGHAKTAIKMTKYLETFPFEFYVVLRDVKMLPSVLAESLKQWFELISLQEGEH